MEKMGAVPVTNRDQMDNLNLTYEPEQNNPHMPHPSGRSHPSQGSLPVDVVSTEHPSDYVLPVSARTLPVKSSEDQLHSLGPYSSTMPLDEEAHQRRRDRKKKNNCLKLCCIWFCCLLPWLILLFLIGWLLARNGFLFLCPDCRNCTNSTTGEIHKLPGGIIPLPVTQNLTDCCHETQDLIFTGFKDQKIFMEKYFGSENGDKDTDKHRGPKDRDMKEGDATCSDENLQEIQNELNKQANQMVELNFKMEKFEDSLTKILEKLEKISENNKSCDSNDKESGDNFSRTTARMQVQPKFSTTMRNRFEATSRMSNLSDREENREDTGNSNLSDKSCPTSVECKNTNFPDKLWERFTDLEAKMCYVINELTYFRSHKFHSTALSLEANREMQRMEELHPQWSKDTHRNYNLTENYSKYADDKMVVNKQRHNVAVRERNGIGQRRD